MKKENSDKIDIIKDTPLKSKKEILNDIIPRYTRQCPKCNKTAEMDTVLL